MNEYAFVIKLSGGVSAKDKEEAVAKINAHIDELSKVDSLKYDLEWPDVSWDIG